MKRLFIGVLLLSAGAQAAELKQLDFASRTVDWKGVKEPLPKRGNYFLPTGFTFEAVLENAIFSYNLITPVVAVAEDTVFYQNKVALPKGSKFIGFVQVLHSLDRVNIDFHTCVFPDGEEIKVGFMALSPDGSAGVKGKVEKHKDAVAAKIAMKSVLAGVQAGAALAAPTVEGAMTTGLSQEAMTSLDTPNVKYVESISVEERTAIKIFVKERTEY